MQHRHKDGSPIDTPFERYEGEIDIAGFIGFLEELPQDKSINKGGAFRGWWVIEDYIQWQCDGEIERGSPDAEDLGDIWLARWSEQSHLMFEAWNHGFVETVHDLRVVHETDLFIKDAGYELTFPE